MQRAGAMNTVPTIALWHAQSQKNCLLYYATPGCGSCQRDDVPDWSLRVEPHHIESPCAKCDKFTRKEADSDLGDAEERGDRYQGMPGAGACCKPPDSTLPRCIVAAAN